MIRRIKSVPSKRRKYKIENFLASCNLPVNVSVSKNCIESGLGCVKKQAILPDGDIIDFFIVNDSLYIQLSDGNLYACTADSATSIKSVGTQKVFAYPISISGEKRVLFCGDFDAFSDNGKTFSKLPRVEVSTFFGGRYFLSDKTALYYTALFDFAKNSTNLNIEGKIWFDDDSGQVLGLYSEDNGVYVFCEHAIYFISEASNGLDFKLDKLEIAGIDLLEVSFAADGENCIFINKGKINLFKNGKVFERESILDGKTFEIQGDPTLEKGKYFLPLRLFGQKKYIYIYDIVEEKESLFELPNESIAKGKFYLYNGQLNFVSEELENSDEKRCVLASIDFNDCKVKTLSGINIISASDCNLEVSGDFGVKSYSLSSGYNALLTNLKSRTFTLEFVSPDYLGVKSLSLEYKLKGE